MFSIRVLFLQVGDEIVAIRGMCRFIWCPRLGKSIWEKEMDELSAPQKFITALSQWG